MTTSAPTTQLQTLENPLQSLLTLLPPGHLSLILGDPGTGKSLLALHLAAHLSRLTSTPIPIPIPNPNLNPNPNPNPNPTPSPTPAPFHSAIISHEDDPRTIHHRLRVTDANTSRIHLLQSRSLVPLPDPPVSPILNELQRLRRIGRTPRLIILDPLPACLVGYDCNHASSIRRILKPLLLFAAKYEAIILGIIHRNKSPRTADPMFRAVGSHVYPALARSVLALIQDDLTFNPARRLLIPLKSSFGPITHAFAFSITSTIPQPPPSPPPLPPLPPDSPPTPLPITPSPPSNSPSAPDIIWELSPITDHPLLNDASPPPADPIEKSQLDEALDFLSISLSAGPVLSTELLKQARALTISPRTLARARHHLQTKTHRDPQTLQWYISLPNSKEPSQ